MKIVVCIKQVPDTVEVKIDPKTGTLIRDGVPSIINHDDKTGIEAALQLKEQLGGTVTVVSMGPPQADVALREALAMGCDEAYLVSAREFGGSDTYATSGIIAAALKKIGYDGINNLTITHCQKTFYIFTDKCFWFVLANQFHIVLIQHISGIINFSWSAQTKSLTWKPTQHNIGHRYGRIIYFGNITADHSCLTPVPMSFTGIVVKVVCPDGFVTCTMESHIETTGTTEQTDSRKFSHLQPP